MILTTKTQRFFLDADLSLVAAALLSTQGGGGLAKKDLRNTKKGGELHNLKRMNEKE